MPAFDKHFVDSHNLIDRIEIKYTVSSQHTFLYLLFKISLFHAYKHLSKVQFNTREEYHVTEKGLL